MKKCYIIYHAAGRFARYYGTKTALRKNIAVKNFSTVVKKEKKMYI